MYLTAVLLYLVALAVLGIRRMRGTAQTSEDFIVAGRSLPASILVFTLLSTWIGSGSLFAGAGLGYRVGLPALWQSAGAWAGIAVIFFLAPRVRRLAQYTVPDVLELKYGSTARVLGAIAIVLAYTAIAAYQFRGGGRLLHLIGGLDPATGYAFTKWPFPPLALSSTRRPRTIGPSSVILAGCRRSSSRRCGSASATTACGRCCCSS